MIDLNQWYPQPPWQCKAQPWMCTQGSCEVSSVTEHYQCSRDSLDSDLVEFDFCVRF